MKKIAIIIADEGEYEPFCEKVKQLGAEFLTYRNRRACSFALEGCEVFAVEAGNGKVNAAATAAYVIAEKKPDAVLNAGYSGAVSGVKRDDFAAGSSYYECDFDLTALGYKLGEKPGKKFFVAAEQTMLSLAAAAGLPQLKLGTGDLFLTSDEKKRHFAAEFGIAAFDMESAALAAVCEDAAVPFLSVRKISDDSENSAATDYREMNLRCEHDLSEILLFLVREYCKV